MDNLLRFFALLLVLTCICPVFAADKPGSKDHPLLSRMQGYSITEYATTDFGAAKSVSGVNCEKPCSHPAIKDGGLIAEGRVTQFQYEPADPSKKASGLTVLRNYDNAVKQLGGIRISNGGDVGDYVSGGQVYSVPSVKGDPKSAPVYVLLEIFTDNYRLAVVEPKAMEQTVAAGELAKEIKSKGFITLYINFGTGKWDVPEDAKKTLSEVAKMLREDPKLSLSVEGHTDNVGAAADNLKLSENRARSVMQTLVAGGVDSKRLKSKGLGQTAPVADNRAEEGRAKNRRVELVKM
jgi:outer membrane protein OmpA-like peptidoglycan-associated protein